MSMVVGIVISSVIMFFISLLIAVGSGKEDEVFVKIWCVSFGILETITIIVMGLSIAVGTKMIDEDIIVKRDNIIFESNQIESINNQLKDIVQEYAAKEGDIILNSKVTDVKIIGQLYPEIKSNELYKELMASYQNHNNNLVTGIKDYNNLVSSRRKYNKELIIGRFIPICEFETIKSIEEVNLMK